MHISKSLINFAILWLDTLKPRFAETLLLRTVRFVAEESEPINFL